LAVAEEAGVEFETLLYLKQRPDRSALQKLVGMLEDPVEDLVRKDSKFKALGLNPADYVGNAAAVVALLDEHIALLQRPVLVRGGKAIIGRPKDRIGAFLSS
jgi:arsenate reductase